MSWVVDTAGDAELRVKTELDWAERPYTIDKETKVKAVIDIFKRKRKELDRKIKAEEDLEKKLTTLKIDDQFDEFFSEMGWTLVPGIPVVKKEKKCENERLFHFKQLDLDSGKIRTTLGAVAVDKEMEKSVLKPGIEKEHCLPQYNMSEKKLRSERKKEREKTKGPGWFNMAAPELTEEIKNDLQILKMRSAMDPKHFYKKNDMEVLPKYFQVGRIMDNPLDHSTQRLTNKQRKRTMVDELLADAEFQKYNKKKYKQIIDDKRKSEYRTHMRDKRQKNKADLKSGKTKPKGK